MTDDRDKKKDPLTPEEREAWERAMAGQRKVFEEIANNPNAQQEAWDFYQSLQPKPLVDQLR